MAIYQKGTINFIPVVDQINRKFTIRANKSKAKEFLRVTKNLVLLPAVYMGAGTRVTYRGGVGEVRKNYLFMRENNRQSVISADEIAAQNLFGSIGTATSKIMKDLNQISSVQSMYKTALTDLSKTCNGVSAEGYTLRGWVFAVQHSGKSSSASYNEEQFPTAFDD